MRTPTLTTILAFAGTCLSALLLITSCSWKSAPEAGLDDLSIRFQAANQAPSIEPMLALYCLTGCDTLMTSGLKGALAYELGLPIEKIQFEGLTGAAEETIEFSYNGIAYGPSLEPRYRMRVIYDVEDGFTSIFTVGQNNRGEWQIICAKPKPPLKY